MLVFLSSSRHNPAHFLNSELDDQCVLERDHANLSVANHVSEFKGTKCTKIKHRKVDRICILWLNFILYTLCSISMKLAPLIGNFRETRQRIPAKLQTY